MTSVALIVVSVVIFVALGAIVLRLRDDLFAVFYGFLFLYTIFTQIGYVLTPDLAAGIGAYYGPEIFLDYWAFVNGSLVAIVAVRLLFRVGVNLRPVPVPPLLRMHEGTSAVGLLVTAGGYLAVLAVLFALQYDRVRYSSIDNPLLTLLIFFQPLVLIVLYACMRRYPATPATQNIAVALFIMALLLFLAISVRAGQRMSLIQLFVGVATFELMPLGVALRHRPLRILGLVTGAFVVLGIASRILEIRGAFEDIPIAAIAAVAAQNDAFDTPSLLQRLVMQDYFAPSLPLIASLHHSFVIPAEVLMSNALNALPGFRYATLAETVGRLVDPRVTRNEGFAYYLLTEGYNAAGWLGIAYNALIVNAGIALWRLTVRTTDSRVTHIMLAVAAAMSVTVVRGPSYLFIRLGYLQLLPMLVMTYFAIGYGVRWRSPRPAASRGLHV